jgi:hypothetical protein
VARLRPWPRPGQGRPLTGHVGVSDQERLGPAQHEHPPDGYSPVVKRAFYTGGMTYRWWWWALENLSGVEPHEVAQVLATRRRMPIGGTLQGLPVVGIHGRTLTGRPLIVVIRLVDDHDQEIIGVREMDPQELATFEAWEAGNNG